MDTSNSSDWSVDSGTFPNPIPSENCRGRSGMASGNRAETIAVRLPPAIRVVPSASCPVPPAIASCSCPGSHNPASCNQARRRNRRRTRFHPVYRLRARGGPDGAPAQAPRSGEGMEGGWNEAHGRGRTQAIDHHSATLAGKEQEGPGCLKRSDGCGELSGRRSENGDQHHHQNDQQQYFQSPIPGRRRHAGRVSPEEAVVKLCNESGHPPSTAMYIGGAQRFPLRTFTPVRWKCRAAFSMWRSFV